MYVNARKYNAVQEDATHLIKHNGEGFYQMDGRPEVVRADEIDAICDQINHMMPKIPTHDNTTDQSIHCPHCTTVHWLSEQRDGRCPYCWRLV